MEGVFRSKKNTNIAQPTIKSKNLIRNPFKENSELKSKNREELSKNKLINNKSLTSFPKEEIRSKITIRQAIQTQTNHSKTPSIMSGIIDNKENKDISETTKTVIIKNESKEIIRETKIASTLNNGKIEKHYIMNNNNTTSNKNSTTMKFVNQVIERKKAILETKPDYSTVTSTDKNKILEKFKVKIALNNKYKQFFDQKETVTVKKGVSSITIDKTNQVNNEEKLINDVNESFISVTSSSINESFIFSKENKEKSSKVDEDINDNNNKELKVKEYQAPLEMEKKKNYFKLRNLDNKENKQDFNDIHANERGGKIPFDKETNYNKITKDTKEDPTEQRCRLSDNENKNQTNTQDILENLDDKKPDEESFFTKRIKFVRKIKTLQRLFRIKYNKKNDSAFKIQKVYKGYITRRNFKPIISKNITISLPHKPIVKEETKPRRLPYMTEKEMNRSLFSKSLSVDPIKNSDIVKKLIKSFIKKKKNQVIVEKETPNKVFIRDLKKTALLTNEKLLNYYKVINNNNKEEINQTNNIINNNLDRVKYYNDNYYRNINTSNTNICLDTSIPISVLDNKNENKVDTTFISRINTNISVLTKTSTNYISNNNKTYLVQSQYKHYKLKNALKEEPLGQKNKKLNFTLENTEYEIIEKQVKPMRIMAQTKQPFIINKLNKVKPNLFLLIRLQFALRKKLFKIRQEKLDNEKEKERTQKSTITLNDKKLPKRLPETMIYTYFTKTINADQTSKMLVIQKTFKSKFAHKIKDEQKQVSSIIEEIKETKEVINNKPIINKTVVLTKLSKQSLSKISYVIYIQRLFKTKLMKRLRENPEKIVEIIKEENKPREKKLLYTNNVFTKESKINNISNIELIQNNYKNKIESKNKPVLKEEVSIYESATEYQNVSNFFTQTKKKLVIDTNCYFHKSNKAKFVNEDKIKLFQILFKKKLEKEKRERKKEKKAPTQDELINKLKELNDKLIITANNNEISLNDEFMFTPEIKETEEQEKTYRSKMLYIDNCVITKTSSLNYNQKITQKIIFLQEEGKDYINRLRLSNENKKEVNVICLENNTEILHNEECKNINNIMVIKKKPLITFKGNANISSYITKKIKVITRLAEEKLIVVQKSFKLSKKNTKKDNDDNTNLDDGFTNMEVNNQPITTIKPSAPEIRIMRTANSISTKPFICNKKPTCKPASTLKKLINLQRVIKWKMLLIKSKKQLVLNSIRNKVIISRKNNQCIYNEFTKKPTINLEKLNTRVNSIQQSYKYYLNEKNNKLEKSDIDNTVIIAEVDHPVRNKIIIKDDNTFTKAIKNCNTSKISVIQKEVKDRLERRARLDDEYNKNLNDNSKIEMNSGVDQINIKKIIKKNKILPAIYISKEYRADLNKTVENLQINIVEYILTKPYNKNLRLPNKRSSLKQVINNNNLKNFFEQEYINTSINIQKQKQNDINHEKGIDFSLSPLIKEKTFSKVNNVPYVSGKINKRNSLNSLLLVIKIQRFFKKKLEIKKAQKAEEEKLHEDKNILIAKTRTKIHNIHLASCIISKKIGLNNITKIISLQSNIKQHLSNKDVKEIENSENDIIKDNQIEDLNKNQIIKKTAKKLLNNNICYFTKEHKSTIGNINSIKNIQKKFRSRNAAKKKEYYRATTGEYTFETIPENNINSTFFNNNKEVLEKSTADKVNEKENQLIITKPKITETLYNKTSKPRFNINKILYLQKLVRIFFNNKKKQESRIRTKVVMNYNTNIHIIYKTNRNNVLLEKTILIQNNVSDYSNNKRVRLQMEKAKNSIVPSYNDNYEIIKEKPIMPIKPIFIISQKPYEIVKKNSCKPSLINLVKLQRKFKLRLNDLRSKNQKAKELMDLEHKISNEVKDTKPKKLPLRYNSFYATKNHVADTHKHKILLISKVKNWINSFPKHDTTIYTEYATSNIENIRTPIKDNSNNQRDKSRNSYNLVITKEKETFINQSKSRDPSKDEILKQSKDIYNITTIKTENKLPIKKPKNYLKFYATKNQKAIITNANVMTIIKNVKHFHSKYIKKRANVNNRSQSYIKNEQDKNSNLSLTYSDIRLNLENKILKEKLHTTTYKKIYKTPICINKDINSNVNRKILNRNASIIQKLFKSYALNRNRNENITEISHTHQDCVFSQVNTQGVVYTKEVYVIENDKVNISSDSLIKRKELENVEKEEIISKHFISSFIITKKPKMCMNNINNNIQKLQSLYRSKKQTENIKPIKKNIFEQLVIDNNESSNIYKNKVLSEDKPAKKILYKLPNCYFSKTATVLPVSGIYSVQRLYRNYISNKNDKLLLNQTHDDTSYLTKNDRTTSNISHVFASNNQPEPVLINKPFVPCVFTKISKRHIEINEPAIRSLQVRFRSSRKKANNLKETGKLYKDLNSLVETIKISSLRNVFDDLKDYQINDICRENLHQMFTRKLVVDLSSDIYYISVMRQMSVNMSCFASIITERKRDVFALLKKCYKNKLIKEKQNKHHLYLERIFKTNTINMIERINRVNGLMLNKNINSEEKKSNTETDDFNVDFYMDKFKNDELMLKYVKAVGNMSISELRENEDKEINNI